MTGRETATFIILQDLEHQKLNKQAKKKYTEMTDIQCDQHTVVELRR